MGHEKHRTLEEGTKLNLEDSYCLGGEKMVKESARKCSHCGHNGHNSRTCHGNGGKCFKLFGVNIVSGSDHQSVVQSVDQSLKKSVSMCNLESHDSEDHHVHEIGYLSDGVIQHRKGKAAHERKKGKPWTEAEHMTFLAGLEKFGKGDWRGISKKFVPTRTPTQVASHAQKYFLRQAATDKKKRRSSLFDMPLNKEPASAPRDLSISSSSKNSVTSSEASSSNVVPLKHTIEMPAQVTTPSQSGSRFPTLCLNGPAALPMVPTTGVPSYHGIPYMVGVPGNGQRYTTALPNLSLVPVMNYPRTGYMYMPKSHGSLGTCGHINTHPSGIPSPRAVSHEPFRPGPSLSEKDGLELKISPA